MVRYFILLLSLLGAVGICLLFGGFCGSQWLWLLPVGFAVSFLVIALAVFLTLWVSCLLVNVEKKQEKDRLSVRAGVYCKVIES